MNRVELVKKAQAAADQLLQTKELWSTHYITPAVAVSKTAQQPETPVSHERIPPSQGRAGSKQDDQRRLSESGAAGTMESLRRRHLKRRSKSQKFVDEFVHLRLLCRSRETKVLRRRTEACTNGRATPAPWRSREPFSAERLRIDSGPLPRICLTPCDTMRT